jgi:hypothetical protein
LAARLAGLEEMPECTSALGKLTGTFFVKSESNAFASEEAAANAERMKSAMAQHNKRMVPKPTDENALGRLLRMLRLRLSEIFASREFSDHRSIAEYFGAKTRQGLASEDRL